MKKVSFKDVLSFLICYFILLLPSLIIPIDKSYYASLNKISIMPFVYVVIWSVIYFILSIVWLKAIQNKQKRLKIYLVLNYLMNVGFLVSFKYHYLFLSFVFCMLCFISILFSYFELLLFNKKLSKWLIIYITWSIIATIFCGYIFLKN